MSVTTQDSAFDIVVAGAGIGGICAAGAAARLGVRVLLVERDAAIGGTGVHSPVILVCFYRGADGTPVNIGLHRELLPQLYDRDCGTLPTYDERDLARRYDELIAAEPTLTTWTGTAVAGAECAAGAIRRIRLEGGRNQWVSARFFIDSTAEGNLGAIAGAEYQKGRELDGAMQPATLTFKVTDVDWRGFKANVPFTTLDSWDKWTQVQSELEPYYQALRQSGKTSNPRENVLCFAYPDNKSLLFNQTRILGVDPTDAASMAAAMAEGKKQIQEFWEAVRQHPAFGHARIEFISSKLGVREGRRIVGDYILTEQDCLGEARFEDMVAACANPLDIHNPTGSGGRMVGIPGSGYYHIPYRCLRAKGFANLLMGSRCISGTHEAHSSYRIMAPIAAIGQAAGVAAALAVRLDQADVRAINAAQIRHVLRKAGQFVQGACEDPGVD